MTKSMQVVLISALVGVLAAGFFFIEAYTPDVTEINTGGESLTIESGARFYVTTALKVKTLDGQSIKWKPKFTANAISVLLPPGSHTFTLDFETSEGDTKWSAKDLKIDADFMSGKYYRFNYSLDTETKNITYSIRESDPVVYKSGFDPHYGTLIIAVIAFCVTIVSFLWNKYRPKIKILQPFDGTSNKENAANLMIRACYQVKEYNGHKVKWSSTVARAASILLPPGKCFIVFDYSEEEGGTTHTAANHNANGSLEAGKTYLIKSDRYNSNGGTTMATHIVECNGEELKTYLSGSYSPVTKRR
jgi:hypothetical protein